MKYVTSSLACDLSLVFFETLHSSWLASLSASAMLAAFFFFRSFTHLVVASSRFSIDGCFCPSLLALHAICFTPSLNRSFVLHVSNAFFASCIRSCLCAVCSCFRVPLCFFSSFFGSSFASSLFFSWQWLFSRRLPSSFVYDLPAPT